MSISAAHRSSLKHGPEEGPGLSIVECHLFKDSDNESAKHMPGETGRKPEESGSWLYWVGQKSIRIFP